MAAVVLFLMAGAEAAEAATATVATSTSSSPSALSSSSSKKHKMDGGTIFAIVWFSIIGCIVFSMFLSLCASACKCSCPERRRQRPTTTTRRTTRATTTGTSQPKKPSKVREGIVEAEYRLWNLRRALGLGARKSAVPDIEMGRIVVKHPDNFEQLEVRLEDEHEGGHQVEHETKRQIEPEGNVAMVAGYHVPASSRTSTPPPGAYTTPPNEVDLGEYVSCTQNKTDSTSGFKRPA